MASYRKNLLTRIDEVCGSRPAFCKAVGISEGELQDYLTGREPMSYEFLDKASEILSIPAEEIGCYFFIDRAAMEMFEELYGDNADLVDLEDHENIGRFKNKDEQIEFLLGALAHEIGDPDSILVDGFDARIVKKKISNWYSITQSLCQVLMKLKNEHKIDDPDLLRRFNYALKRFGWGEAKKPEDLYEDKLEACSPYVELSEQFFIKNMIVQRGISAGEREVRKYYKEQKEYVDSLTEEDKLRWLEAKKKEFELFAYVMDEAMFKPDEERIYLDESSDVSKIYASTPQDRAKAMTDINEVKALKERYEDIFFNHVDKNRYLNSHRETIMRELIEECIALGYTAGLNANTTEILRRNRLSNTKSNRNEGESNTN